MRCKMLDGLIAISDCYSQKEFVKDKLSGTWSAKNKVWLVPPDASKLSILENIGAMIDKSVYEELGSKKKLQDLLNSIKDKSFVPKDDYSDLFVEEFNGEKFALMQHQVYGANFADNVDVQISGETKDGRIKDNAAIDKMGSNIKLRKGENSIELTARSKKTPDADKK